MFRLSSRPGDHRRHLLLFGGTLIGILLALFLAAPTAHVDSPFNDVTRPHPQGSGGDVTDTQLQAGAATLHPVADGRQ